jgi:hypothetical protein
MTITRRVIEIQSIEVDLSPLRREHKVSLLKQAAMGNFCNINKLKPVLFRLEIIGYDTGYPIAEREEDVLM